MSPRAFAAQVLALALAAPHLVSALPTNTWLVAIGNNHGAANEVGLLYAERDAQEFADVLRQHGHVTSRKTLMMLGDDADSVRRGLLDINAAIRAAGGKDESTALVVFYSGHADATSLHLGGTELALDEIKAFVEGSPAGMRLLIVDACRSGTVTRVKGVTAAESFPIEVRTETAPEGVAIITSSAAGESSQESDSIRGSFFTHHLINALRGAADSNADGQITLSEAYAYAYAQTLRSSGQTMALQHPTYSWSVKGRDSVVLSTPAQTQGRMGRLRLREASTYLIMEKRDGGPVVAELAPPSPRAEIVLPAGDYFVQQRERDEFREFQVTLPSGAALDLAAMRYRSVRYDRLVRRRGGEETRAGNVVVVAGARGEMISGEGVMPQLTLGYGMDFEWGSLGLRARGSTVAIDGVGGFLPRRHSEFALGPTLQRVVDFPHVSLAFGLFVEAVRHVQTFASNEAVPSRSSWGATFGGLFSLETHLTGGLALRMETGPISGLFERAVVSNGAEVSHGVATPLTWWLAGGLAWHQ